MSLFAAPSRYALIALACLVTHNLIMIAGNALGQTIVVAAIESFTTVVVIGYLLHSRYTFEAPKTWPGFLRYTATMAVNLPASITIVWLFADLLGWPMTLAAPAATASMIVANFFASRWAITFCLDRKAP